MAIARRQPGDAAPRPEVHRIKFPRPRYRDIIVADPANYNWIPMPGAGGVDHKFIGSFTERGTWIDMVRIAPGATWTSTHADARRVLAVLSGDGEAHGVRLGWMGAVRADAGEELSITATTEMELWLIGLPPVPVPKVETARYDIVDGTGNVTQFEDVRDIENVIGSRR
jgi:hypothetical protein